MKFADLGKAPCGFAVRACLTVVLVLAAAFPALAFQDRPHTYALEGVRIVVAPGQVIDKGNVIVRDGLIEAAGADVEIPGDAEILKPKDDKTWTVYPAFIDAAAHLGFKAKKNEGNDNNQANQKANLANDLSVLRPEYRVASDLDPKSKDYEKHGKLGYAIAHVLPKSGVIRGASAVISLGKGDDVRNRLLVPEHAQMLAFDTTSGYPNSRMGAIATTRQYFYDVQMRDQWRTRYQANPAGMERPPVVDGDDATMDVLGGDTPLYLSTRNLMSYGRFADLKNEFNLKNLYAITNGDEWLSMDAVQALGAKLCFSFSVPKKPKVDKDEDLVGLELDDMQAYLAAKKMPAKLTTLGVEFAFTTAGLVSTDSFFGNLEQAIKHGLTEDQALAALTTTPASWLGIESVAGTVESGKIANLIVVEDDLFVEKPKFQYMFVDGVANKIAKDKEAPKKGTKKGLVGNWSVTFSGMGQEQTLTFVFTGSPGSYGGYWEQGDQRMEFDSVTLEGTDLTVVTPSPAGMLTISGTLEDGVFEGSTTISTPDGDITLDFVGYGPTRN